MKVNFRSIFLILLIVISTSLCYGESGNFFKPTILQSYSNGYNFSALNHKFKISNTGDVSVYSGTKPIKSFKLGNKGYEIPWLYYIPYQNDLILFYHVNMISEDMIKLTRYKFASGQVIWDYTSGSFNMGPCLLENNYLYLCFFGFAGKINVDTGKFVWQDDDDFYGKFGINTFRDITLEGNIIKFTGNVDKPKRNSGVIILSYDKNTGEKL